MGELPTAFAGYKLCADDLFVEQCSEEGVGIMETSRHLYLCLFEESASKLFRVSCREGKNITRSNYQSVLRLHMTK